MEEDALNETATSAVALTNDQLYLKEFIIMLETLPEVWDSSSQDSLNKVKRANAFEKLLKIFKKIKPVATIKDVITKVNSLKSNYRKEFKKIADSRRSGAATDDIYKPKSWVFHMLHFLNKTERPIDVNEFSTPPIQDEQDQSQEPSFSSLNEPGPPSKKQKKKGPVARQNDLLEKACGLLSQPAPPAVPKINSTALYWTEKLEKLNPTQRLLAEKGINEILLEAALGTLNRNSIQINQFTTPAVTPSPSYTIDAPTVSPASYTIESIDASTVSPTYSSSISTVPSVPSSKQYVVISSKINAAPHFAQSNIENTITSGVPSQLTITNTNSVNRNNKYNLQITEGEEEDEYTAGMLFSTYNCQN